VWLKRAGKNLARMATVSTNIPKNGAVDPTDLLNDGNGKIEDNSARWLGKGKAMPHIITFRWDKAVELSAMRIISGRYNGARILDPISDFKLQSFNGESWQDVMPMVKDNKNPVWSARFTSLKTKNMRFVITRAPHNISRLWEIEFYQPDSPISKN
jgi:hypothetical protein